MKWTNASEAEMIEAIKIAHVVIKEQCAIMAEFMKELGKETKREYSHEEARSC